MLGCCNNIQEKITHIDSLAPTPHLQAGAETLLEDIKMSGIENKLQRLLPVGQGECGAERVHQQAANLHPEGVPT